jgi:DNA-binding protein H-NS
MVGKVTGRNILDDEFGGINFRNEKGRFDKLGALGLVDSVKSAMAGGNIKTTKLQQGSIVGASSTLAENLGKNTLELQKAIDEGNSELKGEMTKLIKQLAAAQQMQGKKSVAAIREIIKTVETIKESSPGVSGALDLDAVQKKLMTAAVGSRMGRFKESMNIDQNLKPKNKFFAENLPTLAPIAKGAGQAVTNMFGDAGFLGFGAKSKEEIQMRNMDTQDQIRESAQALDAVTEKLAVFEEKQEETVEKTSKTTEKNVKNNNNAFKTGIDRDNPKTEELLEDIKKELEKITDNTIGVGGGGGAGLLAGAGLGALFGRLGSTITGAITAGLAAGMAGLKGLADAVSSRLPGRTTTVPPSRAPGGMDPRTPGSSNPTSSPDRPRGATRNTTVPKRGGIFRSAGRAAGRLARFAGPAGAVITAGTAGYSAGKGFMADERASTTDRLFNAGNSALNTLSFGFLGRSAEEIESVADQRAALTAPTLAIPSVVPTGNAIENTIPEESGSGSTTINNITNNNSTTQGGASENILINRDTVRNSDSTLQRREDKSFSG